MLMLFANGYGPMPSTITPIPLKMEHFPGLANRFPMPGALPTCRFYSSRDHAP